MILAGIPIIYYGDEQGFNGGADPQNREPIWGRMNKEYFIMNNSLVMKS